MRQQMKWKIFLMYALLLIGSVGTGTIIGGVFSRLQVPETNTVVVYIFFVVLSTSFVEKYAYAYGVVAAVLSTLAYNFFFTEPYYDISVNDPTYLITFMVMIVISIIIGTLTTRVRINAERVKQKEFEVVQERYRANLLRAISHDLRTPLAGIMGNSEMLMGMIEKKDVKFGIAEGIHRDADWLYSLVENILSLTRLQNGQFCLDKQPELAEELVGAAVSKIEMRSARHEIRVEIPSEPIWVSVDAYLVDQVLVNLLDNAVKNTREEDEILVKVEKSEKTGEVIFIVADRGKGLSEGDREKIFQMFYINCKNDSGTDKGVGLGLVICETIVKAHGGRIWGDNRRDGRGAVFTFTIPWKEEKKYAE